MKFVFSLSMLASSLATTAFGLPDPILETRGEKCISNEEADTFIANFQTVIAKKEGWETLACDIIAEDLVEHSNSFISARNQSIGSGIAFKTRDVWIDHIAELPPWSPKTVEILVGCNTIMWMWNDASYGPEKLPVRGFAYFTMKQTGKTKCLQAEEISIEFDSLAFARAAGLDLCAA